MVAMLAFGGTYAYFTASTASASEEVKTGYVKLETTSAVTSVIAKTAVLPGDPLITGDIVYTVDTTDTAGNYVAVKITITAKANDTDGTDVTEALGIGSITPGTSWAETSTGSGIYFLSTAVKDGETATISDDEFVLSADLADNWVEGQASSTEMLQDATITITIQARSIQASHVGAETLATTLAGLFA